MGKSRKSKYSTAVLRSKGAGENVHHKINKVRGGSNHDNNLGAIQIRTHDALHLLFGNETPAEAIMSLLKFFGKVFTDEFKKDLLAVLAKHKGNEHKPECYHGDRIKNGGTRNTLPTNKDKDGDDYLIQKKSRKGKH